MLMLKLIEAIPSNMGVKLAWNELTRATLMF